jgi:malate dehydrogenase (oxaloacetate-decarboxylating)(NADP+)
MDVLDLNPKSSVVAGSLVHTTFKGQNAYHTIFDGSKKTNLNECITRLGPFFQMAFLSGMKIDDIKVPDCNYVTDRLKELMGIELIHENPYGNAIVCLAALINACKVTGR